jgi:formylglycine-generating enzyme required for sulfatase activity
MFFRSRHILSTSVFVAAPLLTVFGACSSSPSNVGIQGGNMGFGDGGTVTHPDATTDAHVVHPDAKSIDAVVGTKDVSLADVAHDVVEVHDGTFSGCTSDTQCPSRVCATAPVVVRDGGGEVDAGVRPDCSDAGAGCVCQPRTCTDGVFAPPETGIDCGNKMLSGCPACPDGQGCATGTDCLDGVCGHVLAGGACPPSADAGTGTGGMDGGACVCSPPSCDDGVKNGSETDVDCGGAVCHACNTGKTCTVNADCTSDICTMGGGGSTCTCPMGMVEVTTSKGAPYCIDAYEVTFGQYQVFLNKNVDPSTQPAECKLWNTSFAPQGLVSVPGTATDNNPVTNVNWCDAFMYCQTFGKHLCGSTSTPGAATPFNSTAQNDETQDEWYNACSTQGSNMYTYGNAYIPNACNTSDSILQCITMKGPPITTTCNLNSSDPFVNTDGIPCVIDPNFSCNTPDNEYFTLAAGQAVSCEVESLGANPSLGCNPVAHEATCHNMAGIFDMNGNVWEWENSCGAYSPGDAGAQDSCLVRGGAFDSPKTATSTACPVSADQPPLPRYAVQAIAGGTEHEDLGIRCCL